MEDIIVNRKRRALLTGLTIFLGTSVSSTDLIKTSNINEIEAAKLKTKLKANKKYPDVTKELDITSMEQYASNMLFMNVTLKKFYVKDYSIDTKGKYHLLLVPIKTSDQYFLVIIDSDAKITKNQQISVQGFLNGKTRIDFSQGFNKKYLDKKAVSILADNFTIYK